MKWSVILSYFWLSLALILVAQSNFGEAGKGKEREEEKVVDHIEARDGGQEANDEQGKGKGKEKLDDVGVSGPDLHEFMRLRDFETWECNPDIAKRLARLRDKTSEPSLKSLARKRFDVYFQKCNFHEIYEYAIGHFIVFHERIFLKMAKFANSASRHSEDEQHLSNRYRLALVDLQNDYNRERDLGDKSAGELANQDLVEIIQACTYWAELVTPWINIAGLHHSMRWNSEWIEMKKMSGIFDSIIRANYYNDPDHVFEYAKTFVPENRYIDAVETWLGSSRDSAAM